MPTGDVQITIQDGGGAVVNIPSTQVQLVIGCCSGGVANQIVATSNPNTLAASCGYGPGVEAAGIACQAGATVLFCKATTTNPGSCGAVQSVKTGTSAITASGAAYDDYLVKFLVVTGGTIGTAGIAFQVSLDGGKNFGSPILLGTANSYLIPNTNVALNFGAGTLVAADYAQFQCTAPAWNTAGVQAALQAFQASQYALQGVGSIHIVGVCSGANASTIEGYLDTLATGHIFDRAMLGARDATAPIAWTGTTGETETAWISALAADYASVSAKRLCVTGGHYNMPSPFANPAGGAPRYRRPLSYALAARQTTIPPQRHAGRVRDGNLSAIVVDAVADPQDGFIYHDERIQSGLDAARFASSRTRIGFGGFFIVNPNLMSPPGSQFTLLPLGNVIDVASDIAMQTGQQEIDDDVRLKPNGTIDERDALAIEGTVNAQLAAKMVNANMVSSAAFVVDRSYNVGLNNKVQGTLSVLPRGYILELDITLLLLLPNQAGG